MEIVVLERITVGLDVSIEAFNKFGNVTSYNTTPVDLIQQRVKDADIIIANKSPINETTLKGASKVKLICEFATGFDNIDLDYCKSKGIKVCNVKGYSTDAVVQHTFGLCLYILEKLNHYDNYVKSGEYAKCENFCYFGMNYGELAKKTWGIIGMGAIGSKVAKIATAFGCNVVRFSPQATPSKCEYKTLDFDEFLGSCDIISIHCPLNDDTRELMNIDAFYKMKNDAILINVARGGIVNDADLYKALNENMIYGAGLDVTNTEPMSPDNPLSQYKDSNRLIITPHMAWASNEARLRLVEETVFNIEAFIEGRDRNTVI